VLPVTEVLPGAAAPPPKLNPEQTDVKAEEGAELIDTYQKCLNRIDRETERGRAAVEPTQTDVTRDSTATNRTPLQHIRTHL
jgi:hypothetical protein